MDQEHRHVNISPLFVGLLGVISGAIIVATFHCILVSCRNTPVETNNTPPRQLPRVQRRINTNAPGIGQENYNPSSISSNSSLSTSASTSSSASMRHLLPVHKYTREFKEGACAICLGEFQEDEEIRILPECAHLFHVSCIDMWLFSHANCPLCRAVTTPRGGHHVVDLPRIVLPVPD